MELAPIFFKKYNLSIIILFIYENNKHNCKKPHIINLKTWNKRTDKYRLNRFTFL